MYVPTTRYVPTTKYVPTPRYVPYWYAPISKYLFCSLAHAMYLSHYFPIVSGKQCQLAIVSFGTGVI